MISYSLAALFETVLIIHFCGGMDQEIAESAGRLIRRFFNPYFGVACW